LATQNGYSSPVDLSCGTGAPPTCTAAPTPLVPTQSGAAFTVTASSTQCGTFTFNVVGTGRDSQKTQHVFPVTYTATSYTKPNFTLDISPASLTSAVNTPAVFNGTLTGTNCYNSPVNLSCGSNAPPTCSASPPTVTPTVSGSSFTVTASSDVAATYNFNIAAAGTDSDGTSHFFLAQFTATSPFTMTANPTSQSVSAGQAATFDLDLAPSAGTFPDDVALNYDLCPVSSTCSLSTTQITKGSGNTHVKFTIATTASHAAMHTRVVFTYALWFLLPGLIVGFGSLRSNRLRENRIALLLWLTLIVSTLGFAIACGGGLQGGNTGNQTPPAQGTGGQSGTPAGSYPINISATMGRTADKVQLTLTVN